MIEGIFGWLKTAGGVRQARVRQDFAIRGAAYNLMRISKLLEAT